MGAPPPSERKTTILPPGTATVQRLSDTEVIVVSAPVGKPGLEVTTVEGSVDEMSRPSVAVNTVSVSGSFGTNTRDGKTLYTFDREPTEKAK